MTITLAAILAWSALILGCVVYQLGRARGRYEGERKVLAPEIRRAIRAWVEDEAAETGRAAA